MARIRTIKPEFWTDEDIAELSEAACLLAIGLLNYADDEGYFNANLKLIKAAVFPIREPSVPIPVMLQELSNHGYLSFFSTPDNRHFGLIRNFAKHQVVNKKKTSKIKVMELLPYEYGIDTGLLPSGKDQGSGKGRDPLSLAGANERDDFIPGENPNSPPPADPEPWNDENDDQQTTFGKIPMGIGWKPSEQFRRQAAIWGRILDGPEPGYETTELASFIAFWQAEGRVFNQTQWEQKFADHVLYERRQAAARQPKNTGGSNAKLQPGSGGSIAEQQLREGREQWLRERNAGGHSGVEAMGSHDQNLRQPLDCEEWQSTLGSLGAADWVDDQ